MAITLALMAALALGMGWVFQRQQAEHAPGSEHSFIQLILRLIRSGRWWVGILGLTVGQSLAGWALQLGPVTLVEASLVTNLLFAYIVAAVLTRHLPRRRELIGAILLCVALGAFLDIGRPRAEATPVAWPGIVAATAATGGLCVVFALAALRRRPDRVAILTSIAAGLMYGLQNVATRGMLVTISHHGLYRALTHSVWSYVLLGSAVAGVLLSQQAFRAAGFRYSLAPTTLAEVVAGIVLGIGLLGDRLNTDTGALAVEALGALVALIALLVIGRSPALDKQLHSAKVRSKAAARSGSQMASVGLKP